MLRNIKHNFIRTVEVPVSLYHATTLNAGDNFMLNKLPNYSEFEALYDQYRIAGVKRTFIWQATSYDQSGTAGAYGPPGAPMLYLVRDYDDSNAPSATSELMQRPYVAIRRLTGIQRFFIRPRLSTLVYESGLSSGYAIPNRAGWIDCTESAIPHFGFKYIIVPQGGSGVTGTTILGTLRIVDRYYLQFKNPR